MSLCFFGRREERIKNKFYFVHRKFLASFKKKSYLWIWPNAASHELRVIWFTRFGSHLFSKCCCWLESFRTRRLFQPFLISPLISWWFFLLLRRPDVLKIPSTLNDIPDFLCENSFFIKWKLLYPVLKRGCHESAEKCHLIFWKGV